MTLAVETSTIYKRCETCVYFYDGSTSGSSGYICNAFHAITDKAEVCCNADYELDEAKHKHLIYALELEKLRRQKREQEERALRIVQREFDLFARAFGDLGFTLTRQHMEAAKYLLGLSQQAPYYMSHSVVDEARIIVNRIGSCRGDRL